MRAGGGGVCRAPNATIGRAGEHAIGIGGVERNGSHRAGCGAIGDSLDVVAVVHRPRPLIDPLRGAGEGDGEQLAAFERLEGAC